MANEGIGARLVRKEDRRFITGQVVRHADGRQLQRVGVQPHIRVEPTIEGIRQGRDEVLEAAVAFLGQTVGK